MLSFTEKNSNTEAYSQELEYPHTYLTPLSLGNLRLEECPVPLQQLGSRAQTVSRSGLNYIKLVNLNLKHKL